MGNRPVGKRRGRGRGAEGASGRGPGGGSAANAVGGGRERDGGRRGGRGGGTAGGGSFGAPSSQHNHWLWSGLLLLLLLLFCTGTKWGRGFPKFAGRTWIVWESGRELTWEARSASGYDETYKTLLFINDSTPSDAVILLPPSRFVMDEVGSESALLAVASSAYNFIYPRVPVHWGDDQAPMTREVTHLLVWAHWGLHLIGPDIEETDENRIAIYPLERTP